MTAAAATSTSAKSKDWNSDSDFEAELTNITFRQKTSFTLTLSHIQLYAYYCLRNIEVLLVSLLALCSAKKLGNSVALYCPDFCFIALILTLLPKKLQQTKFQGNIVLLYKKAVYN
jgi:hypothetical protein